MKPRGFKPQILVPDVEQQSYKVDDDGTLHYRQFNIDGSGMKSDDGDVDMIGSEMKLDELELLDKLGEGQSSVVYRARHRPTGQLVALKQINIFDREKRHQIVKELHTLYRAECPYLISFFGAYFKDGSISITLELMDAGSVRDVLDVMGKMPEPLLAFYAKQMFEGLHYLRKRHQVHRDIKPSNICLNSKGQCKLTDFGIAHQLTNTLEQCNSFVGTAAYMSPERILGKAYSYPSDIWSIGIVLLECATGRYPFPDSQVYLEVMQHVVSGESPRVPVNAGFSKEFVSFIDCCLNKDPLKRASASKLLGHPWLLKDFGVQPEQVQGWVAQAMQKLKQKDEQKHPI